MCWPQTSLDGGAALGAQTSTGISFFPKKNIYSLTTLRRWGQNRLHLGSFTTAAEAEAARAEHFPRLAEAAQAGDGTFPDVLSAVLAEIRSGVSLWCHGHAPCR